MNLRLLKLAGLVLLWMLFAGCSTLAPRLVNLTPQLMPTNPSGIYTLALLLDGKSGAKDVAEVRAIIGGETHAMRADSGKSNLFTFDYSLPSGMNRARYYYEMLDSDGRLVAKSEIFDLRLTNRYVVELESSRAKPGATIAVLGKGFRDTDRIQFGASTAETVFLSENQLVFTVPAVNAGEDYQVSVETSGGSIPIGGFRVDFSELRAMPSRLQLSPGETTTVVFTIDQDAPPEGMPLQIAVSDPQLVEFESISIPGGQRSMHVQFIGLQMGRGHLTVTAPAHNTLTIPVAVESAVEE